MLLRDHVLIPFYQDGEGLERDREGMIDDYSSTLFNTRSLLKILSQLLTSYSIYFYCIKFDIFYHSFLSQEYI